MEFTLGPDIGTVKSFYKWWGLVTIQSWPVMGSDLLYPKNPCTSVSRDFSVIAGKKISSHRDTGFFGTQNPCLGTYLLLFSCSTEYYKKM